MGSKRKRNREKAAGGNDVGLAVVNWLRWADDDYVAARRLLLDDLLVQGAALSNTAIEKYFKTILLIKELSLSKNHDVPKLFGMLKRQGVEIPLNENYLCLLYKAYKLRYPDELRPGFNIAIDRTRLLTELDFSVFTIRQRYKVSGPFGAISSTVDQMQASEDSRLLEKNCYYGRQDRLAVFAENASRYCMRVLAPGFIVQATYKTKGVPDTHKFDIEYEVSRSGNTINGILPTA
jgi:HEPN domain-containing protein